MTDPNLELVKICHKLEADLASARESAPDGGSRDRVVASISAVVDFLRDAGFDQRHRAPFIQLLLAFNDLSEGYTPELLRASQLGVSAAKRPSFEGNQMAVAAAVVTILKDYAKWNLSDALRKAAAAVHVEPKALQEFRRNIRRKRASPAAIDTEEWCMAFYREHSNLTPLQRALKILEIAKLQKG